MNEPKQPTTMELAFQRAKKIEKIDRYARNYGASPATVKKLVSKEKHQ